MKKSNGPFQKALLPVLVIFMLALGGCIGNMFKTPLPGGAPPPQEPVRLSPLEEAEAALARGDYARAEVLGQKLSASPSLSQQESAAAARVYATAAARNQHPSVALTALDSWRSLEQGVDSTRDWQDIWCEAMWQLSSREARAKADALYQDTGRTPAVRGMAGIFFAVRQWEDGEVGQTLDALEAMYKATKDTPTRALFEGRLSLLLHGASAQAASLVAPAVTTENRYYFPYNLIAIDYLNRQIAQGTNRAQAQASLSKMKSEVTLADPSLFNGPPLIKATAPVIKNTSGPVAGARSVVLALPLSSQFSAVSAKIVEGAEVACAEMTASGTPVSVVAIDTDSPDWVSRIESLPADAQVIGGPIRTPDYVEAKRKGLMQKKVFFSFLPGLEGQDEGKTAWRFFASPADQIRTLLDFTGKLNIKNYAVLYPDEAYGQRMARLFEEKTQNLGYTMAASSAYTPNVPDGWLNITGELLAANKNPSQSGFQAIFLPDGWKSSEILVSSIFHFNEPRLVILGTTLWEQGLTGQTTITSPQNYSMAVFPGNWNAQAPSAAGKRLIATLKSRGRTADTWSGLGYDFARMVVSLDIRQGWTTASVNSGLHSLSLGWSGAPMRWDASGQAAQDLFLFTPADGVGFVPANIEGISQTFSDLWQQNQQ